MPPPTPPAPHGHLPIGVTGPPAVQGLRRDGLIKVRISGQVMPLLRCGACKATPAVCDKAGCGGTREPGWRRVPDAGR